MGNFCGQLCRSNMAARPRRAAARKAQLLFTNLSSDSDTDTDTAEDLLIFSDSSENNEENDPQIDETGPGERRAVPDGGGDPPQQPIFRRIV